MDPLKVKSFRLKKDCDYYPDRYLLDFHESNFGFVFNFEILEVM